MSPGRGNGSPLQDSCLENPMDREAGWATVHGVTKSQTSLKWCFALQAGMQCKQGFGKIDCTDILASRFHQDRNVLKSGLHRSMCVCVCV